MLPSERICSSSAHFSTHSPFVLLGFRDDDDLLYLEGPNGGLSNRDDLDLTVRYQECFADISDKAYEGDRLVYFFNGVKVMEGTKVWPSSGRILFQSEGAEIFFRRIELHPLNK